MTECVFNTDYLHIQDHREMFKNYITNVIEKYLGDNNPLWKQVEKEVKEHVDITKYPPTPRKINVVQYKCYNSVMVNIYRGDIQLYISYSKDFYINYPVFSIDDIKEEITLDSFNGYIKPCLNFYHLNTDPPSFNFHKITETLIFTHKLLHDAYEKVKAENNIKLKDAANVEAE